jgi:phytoene synthase
MIRTGSKSFFLASLLLPEDVREAAYALYAFCRLSDDAVDVEGGHCEAVVRLRHRLDRIYAGQPAPEPVDRALADAVEVFALPRTLMDALLEGLDWDVAGRTYETLSDVYAYAARVAGSVGAMMAALMGARSQDMVARACDLGVAMQLSNIARDVGEDARAGRLYLPRAWLREVGIDPDAWLRAPTFTPEIGQVVGRLLQCAEALYARADLGIARLDPAFRPAIYAARLLYAEIGVKLKKRGLDSVSRRTMVSALRKLWLVACAAFGGVRAPVTEQAISPMSETLYLVDAVVRATILTSSQAGGERRGVTDDVVWVLDLFTALDGRKRARSSLVAARASYGETRPTGRTATA